MLRFLRSFWACALLCVAIFAQTQAFAQNALKIVTVDRPPFSQQTADGHEGFSIDLMRAIADDLGWQVEFITVDAFGQMFDDVQSYRVDAAIANISITAAREARVDFSQPIFSSGIKVLMSGANESASLFSILFSWDILVAALLAIAMLFGGGSLMWVFENGRQSYFDKPYKDSIFPSFWWALNLVVNGGFEERMPQSRPGRFFAVILVVSSLFLVSIFVAKITAAVTVEALQDNVKSINDLDGQRVGTVAGSTSEALLTARDIRLIGYDNPRLMLDAFEAAELDAVVFDAPILEYYATQSTEPVRLLERNYKPENYGIVLPNGSPLREAVNLSLLRLREDGTYDAILRKWFGNT